MIASILEYILWYCTVYMNAKDINKYETSWSDSHDRAG